MKCVSFQLADLLFALRSDSYLSNLSKFYTFSENTKPELPLIYATLHESRPEHEIKKQLHR